MRICISETWGFPPLWAKDGEKNPKQEGGRRAATTLLFLPNAIRSMRGIYQQLPPAGAEDRENAGSDLILICACSRLKVRTSNLH